MRSCLTTSCSSTYPPPTSCIPHLHVPHYVYSILFNSRMSPTLLFSSHLLHSEHHPNHPNGRRDVYTHTTEPCPHAQRVHTLFAHTSTYTAVHTQRVTLPRLSYHPTEYTNSCLSSLIPHLNDKIPQCPRRLRLPVVVQYPHVIPVHMPFESRGRRGGAGGVC